MLFFNTCQTLGVAIEIMGITKEGEKAFPWLLPSRANVRFIQHLEFNEELNSNTTDTVYRIDAFIRWWQE